MVSDEHLNAVMEAVATEWNARKEADKPADINAILGRVRYFVAHLDQLIFNTDDPVRSARLFGLIFNQTPTTEDLNCGTPKHPFMKG